MSETATLHQSAREGISVRFLFFPPGEDDVSHSSLRETLESGGHINAGGTFGEARSAIVENVMSEIDAILGERLDEHIIEMWKKSPAVVSTENDSANRDDSPTTVQLAPHQCEFTLAPRIEIVLDGAVVRTIEIGIHVSLAFSGVIITVRRQDVVSLDAGKVSADGRLAIGKQTVATVKTREFELPGRLVLGPEHDPAEQAIAT